MLDFFSGKIIKLYEVFFKTNASENTKKFFKNILYVTAGFGMSSVLGLVAEILCGRILGPIEYGKYALIQSFAAFLYIPMMMGINVAAVKYSAETKDVRHQSEAITTSLIMVGAFSLISIFIFLVFAPYLSGVLKISLYFFYLSILFAVLFVFYTLTTDFLRGIDKMKEFSSLRVIYNIITLSVIIILLLFIKYISFISAVSAVLISYLIISVVILILLYRHISWKFNMVWAKRILRYGLYATIGAITFSFMTNFGQIFINQYLSITDVGIYNAYLFVSTGISGVLLTIFITVFFPFASHHSNKEDIFKKINKIVPYIFIIGWLAIICSSYIILKLYGNAYPFDLRLETLFGLLGILIICDGVYGYLMAASGTRGVMVIAFASIGMALIGITASFLLIPRIGLFGAVIALILSYAFSLSAILSQKKYYKIKTRMFQ